MSKIQTQNIFRLFSETESPEKLIFRAKKMVEAAGVEPASENNQPRLLHTYLKI